MRQQLDLPLPHAKELVDTVLDRMLLDPGYYDERGGCDELDNLLVVALAAEKAGGRRQEELKKLAAYNVIQVLKRHRRRDGGLSYYPARCATAWVDFQMAPSAAQGDALGLATLASGISIAIDVLGLEGKTSWRGYGLNQRPAVTSPEAIAAARRLAAEVFAK